MFILNYHFDCDIIQWVPVVCCRYLGMQIAAITYTFIKLHSER